MKNILAIFLFITTGVAMYAQADVTTAYNANKAGDYDKAVTFIEKSLDDSKAVSKEKTWRYRGNIYLNILSSPEYSAKYPNAAELAMESYFKAMELDKGDSYIKENQLALYGVQLVILDKASKQYESGNFCDAAENFKMSGEISSKFDIVDSAAIFNNAYCNDRCGKSELAIKGYQRSAEIGYNVPDVYIYMADVYTKEEKMDEAKKVISLAREKYPNYPELLRSEVNFLLADKKYDEALSLLKSLANKPDANETIWFVLGATHEKLGNVEEQEQAYKKALEINPNYYDALFNLGATYYNKGIEQLKECESIPPRDRAKYDDCVAKGDVFFTKSVEKLELAYNQKPQDKEIISALMEAYARTGNIEGNKKLRAELEKLK